MLLNDQQAEKPDGIKGYRTLCSVLSICLFIVIKATPNVDRHAVLADAESWR